MTSTESVPEQFLYLAIDQGGHASRALVFDRHGACVAQALVPVAVVEPCTGWVEHDAEAVINSLRQAVTQVSKVLGADVTNIVAAGLATQRASVVCWDRTMAAALTPVLSWRDRRAAQDLQAQAIDAAEIRRRTGLRLSPYYGASKLRWCLARVPAVRAAQARGTLVCGPLASFILFRLLDECPLLVDAANASRTLLWNPSLRDWDPWLLDSFGIPAALLPRSVPTRHRFGSLRIGNHSVPLTVATGDQAAALFALGAPRQDSAYINIGTGAFVQRLWHGDSTAVPEGLLCSVVRQEQDHVQCVLEGTVNGAAAALDAYAQQNGISTDTLIRLLPGWLDDIHDPPLYLNGIGGLGAPFWVADFPSRFIGTGDEAACAVAVVESVVFLLCVVLETMATAVSRPQRLVVSGGLASLDGLCQRLANLAEVVVYRPALSEATARGMAFLLADGPEHWTETQPGDYFQNKIDAPLVARYARWRTALRAAL